MNHRRVLVLGLGNVLCGDDGAGVAAVHRLLHEYELPDGVDALDGGTLGMSLLAEVAETDELVIVDAVRADAAAGSLLRLDGEEVVPAVTERLSVHQVGVLDLLAAARFVDRYPEHLTVVGVVPESTALCTQLSPAVAAALPGLVALVVEELRSRGLAPRRRADAAERGRDHVARVLGL